MCLGNESKSSAEVNYFKEKINRLNEDITKYSKVLPEYQFLTAFSQLVSRICHPHYGVWEILKGKRSLQNLGFSLALYMAMRFHANDN